MLALLHLLWAPCAPHSGPWLACPRPCEACRKATTPRRRPTSPLTRVPLATYHFTSLPRMHMRSLPQCLMLGARPQLAASTCFALCFCVRATACCALLRPQLAPPALQAQPLLTFLDVPLHPGLPTTNNADNNTQPYQPTPVQTAAPPVRCACPAPSRRWTGRCAAGCPAAPSRSWWGLAAWARASCAT